MDSENSAVKDYLQLEEFTFLFFLVKYWKINHASNFILLKRKACQVTKTINKCFTCHGRFF